VKSLLDNRALNLPGEVFPYLLGPVRTVEEKDGARLGAPENIKALEKGEFENIRSG
jgi:hypothetical protein